MSRSLTRIWLLVLAMGSGAGLGLGLLLEHALK
jgi:hypothetical protein